MTDTTPRDGRLLVAALVGLLLVAPTPTRAWQVLAALTTAGGPPTTDPTAAVLAVVALAAWGLAGSLVACTALLILARLPGLAGRCASALAARVIPAGVKRGLGVLLGAGLVLGTAGALPASAETGTTSARTTATAGSALSLDWPTTQVAVVTPADQTVPPAGQTVVVVRGDTLWGLAERSLRAQGSTPSAAAIAAAWPSWWAANREAVGENPHLLLPGTRLAPPPS